MSEVPAPAPAGRVMSVHASMAQFAARSGQLVVGGELLETLANRVGQTPFCAYDRGLLRARVAQQRQALPKAIKLHYAMKANPMPAVVNFMAGSVDGIDVASAGELKVALDADAGADPLAISFAGPGKRETELRQAVAARVLINRESIREVELLGAISRNLAMPARVAVRVNPGFERKGSGMKMGGGPKQIGIDVEQLPALFASLSTQQLSFEGFHLFAGSHNLRAESICDAQRQRYELALPLVKIAPRAIKFLNLGVGFGIRYFPGEQRLDLAPIGENLAALVERAAPELPEAALVIELGRYLVGEPGIYVPRVVDHKVSRSQVFLMTDGGLHHQLAASGNCGQVVRKNCHHRQQGHRFWSRGGGGGGGATLHTARPVGRPHEFASGRDWRSAGDIPVGRLWCVGQFSSLLEPATLRRAPGLNEPTLLGSQPVSR